MVLLYISNSYLKCPTITAPKRKAFPRWTDLRLLRPKEIPIHAYVVARKAGSLPYSPPGVGALHPRARQCVAKAPSCHCELDSNPQVSERL